MRKSEDVADLRDRLILGQAYASVGGRADPLAAVAGMPDDAEICGCNGVAKARS